MVEFFGKIDNNIQAKTITKRGRFLGVLGIIVLLVIMIPYLIVWFVDDGSTNYELIITTISFGLAVILGLIICIPTSRRDLRFVWDYYIKFEDGIITQISNHQNGVTQHYKMSKVKKVVDYGRYYYIFLYRLDPSKGIVCQKDLLINGTIEEFEKLFEGKIIRKLNDTNYKQGGE